MVTAPDLWDVIIVGGGPAGLSAALLLGRCNRRVLVCDSGHPRNRASHAVHGFFSRDGIPPRQLLAEARRDLERYPKVSIRQCEVKALARRRHHFVARLDDKGTVVARKVLLATGLRDTLPALPGIAAFFGRSVFVCPYCDGWENRGQPLAVYARGQRALEMARAMSAWTRDLVVLTNGPAMLGTADRQLLRQNGIDLCESRIERLEGADGKLEAIALQGGQRLARRALFFDEPSFQQSDLARRLGCSFTRSGGVRCGRYEATDVPGVYVAGNTIKDVHLAIVAAAEGAKAALGINKALTREDFSNPDSRTRARRTGQSDRTTTRQVARRASRL